VEAGGYCARVDTLFNLPGVHVLDVAWSDHRIEGPAGLRLVVESHPAESGSQASPAEWACPPAEVRTAAATTWCTSAWNTLGVI
jgi:hypothetical protein